MGMRTGLFVVVLSVIGSAPARAQVSVEDQQARKDAETCAQEAHELYDRDRHDTCAAMYLALFNMDPGGAIADQMLYNAAVEYENAASMGTAITVLETLRAQFPKSPVAVKALARLGMLYARIGWYAEAASALETYARKYASEKDAYAAMSDAVFYRRSLGQHEEAIADTQYFIKTFGAKRVAEAADAYFSLTISYQALGDDAKVVEHLRDYLKRYAGKGSPSRAVVAYAKLGEALWKQSCEVAGVDGLCAKLVRARQRKKTQTQPNRCGPDAIVPMVVVARRDKIAKEAAAALSKAIKQHDKLAGTADDDAAARYHAAQARLHLAEALHEHAMTLTFPTDRKRFERWASDTRDAMKLATDAYQKVVASGDPASMVDAAARIGELWQWYADTLWSAAIPADVRKGKHADAKVEAYCSVMQEQAEPADQLAVDAYAACLTSSSEASVWRPASRRCEQALGRLRPDAFPLTTELRAEPIDAKIYPVVTNQ